jgi:hypothetical protein
MAREGRLPHIRVLNRLRFRPHEIKAWVRLREVSV